jgi:hypothetical protein
MSFKKGPEMAQRYQREIEKILDKTNDESEKAGTNMSASPRRQSRGSQASAPRSGPRFTPRFTPGNLVVAGVVLLITAVVLGSQPLMWIGIALFVIAYVSYFNKPGRNVERRWRGQSIEDEPQPSVVQRLWSWITRT